MKVTVQGMVLEVNTITDNETGQIKAYKSMIFQPGERENIVVITEKNGVVPGQHVLVTGRLSINTWKGRSYVRLYAEQMEVVGESSWNLQQ